jgi:hypothetical protein
MNRLSNDADDAVQIPVLQSCIYRKLNRVFRCFGYGTRRLARPKQVELVADIDVHDFDIDATADCVMFQSRGI